MSEQGVIRKFVQMGAESLPPKEFEDLRRIVVVLEKNREQLTEDSVVPYLQTR